MSGGKRFTRSVALRHLHAALVICTCLVIGCGGSAADDEASDAQAGSKDQTRPTAQAQSQPSEPGSMEHIFERARAAAEAYKKAHPHALTESAQPAETTQAADAAGPVVPGSQPDAAPTGPVSLKEDVGLDVTLPAGSIRRSAGRSEGFAMGNYAIPNHSAAEMMTFFDHELGRLGFTPKEDVPNFGSLMGTGAEMANRGYAGETQNVSVTAMGDPKAGVLLGVFVSDKK